MNTTIGMLETRTSPEAAHRTGVETASSPARTTVSRTALADRLALRLGTALVIWSRQHAARKDARVDVRVVIVARRAETEDRRARQFAADRQALVGMPRR
ncbi:MAG TPA: hypothetical protein VFQ74_06665 [Pseudolysinimonas sp.]|nr:hypothetical protein [Pseudolysinimonas sp.]